jgi:hypothetical protein
VGRAFVTVTLALLLPLPAIAGDGPSVGAEVDLVSPDFESETPFWAHFQAPLVGYH